MSDFPLVPARLAFSADGTPWSEAYGDVYHSADGGPEQSRHVFLRGNGLPQAWRGRERFCIAETGFGLGLNFLETWRAWRGDAQRPRELHFLSVEKHPFGAADLEAAHARQPELAPMAAQLHAAWPMLLPGFHRLRFDDGRVTLTLMFGDAARCLAQLRARADAIYLDGFAPERNPDMWSEGVLRALSRVAAPGATLATWTVAAAVREGLAAAGFVAEKRPGFGRKREMLVACHAPRGHRSSPAPPGPAQRRALVIGGGVAGAAVCERLAARGWDIELLERQPVPPEQVNVHIAGVFRPTLSRDDNLTSRLTRAGSRMALARWAELEAQGLPLAWSRCGVLQVAKDARHERLQREVVADHRYPEGYARFLEVAGASRAAGWPLPFGGWLFPEAGWVNPLTLIAAQLRRHPQRVRRRYGCEVASLARVEGAMRALDAAGAVLAEAPVAILANAAGARAFPEAAALPWRRVRGQMSYVPGHRLADLPLVVCREGCVTPVAQGVACVGATFDHDEDPEPRSSSNAANLERLARLLPGAGKGLDPERMAARVGFRTSTPDRLPMAGALPDADAAGSLREAQLAQVTRHEGLYGVLGSGARGLVWTPVAAELLASMLEGEPLPVEGELADAIDPARFLLRAERRGRGGPVARSMDED